MLPRYALVAGAVLFVAQGPAFEGALEMRHIEIPIDERKESLFDVPTATLAAREDANVERTSMRIKNNVIRFDTRESSADSGYGLMDLGRSVMTMIDPGSRSYMEVPLPGGPGARPAPARGGPAPRPLGQTRTINGMRTVGYEIRTDDQVIRAWMTKDHPGLTWAFSQAAAQGKDNVDDSDDDPTAALAPFGFPVLMITLSDNSLEVEELVKVTPGVQSPDLFRVPAGYTKRTIPGMPGR